MIAHWDKAMLIATLSLRLVGHFAVQAQNEEII
jgi:hypothetical protein